MAETILPNGATMTYEHTCTFEERRFNTCRCRAAATQRCEALPVAAQEPDRPPDRGDWLPARAVLEQSRFGADVMQRLMTVPCHDRLRILRTVMGWTQRELASQLGISRRSVIRYEKDQRRTPWPRLSVLLRLRQVEADHERQLVGYFSSLAC